jgi:hypothetical protein
MMTAVERAAVTITAVVTVVCSGLFILVSGAVAGTGLPAEARMAAVGGAWGIAREVPGTAALNQTGFARVRSVSCGSAGNCSAGGFYWAGNFHPFVVSQVKGTWHTAIEVPGVAALNQHGNAEVNSVSCASAGNCSAGGYYTDFLGQEQAFVADEVNGTWHASVEVPGTAALNQFGGATVVSVSCASAGNCSAGGSYTDSSGFLRAFVASEVNGTWHNAIEVRRTTALSQAHVAEVDSVSCASAGNCGAGGFYWDASGLRQAFVVREVNGTWRRAIPVPGTATRNRGGDARIASVSCASAGNCIAGGYYSGSIGQQAFVVSEVNGTWRTAIKVPGTATLNKGGYAAVNSVSCASAGNCSVAGFYHAGSRTQQAFVASEVHGTWHNAIKVPGTATLNKGGDAAVNSVSCASAGNCSAGGFYSDSSNAVQALVVSEVNGTWRTAIKVPGTATLNKDGGAAVFSVSCAAAGKCSAGGSYQDGSANTQAFVVSQT